LKGLTIRVGLRRCVGGGAVADKPEAASNQTRHRGGRGSARRFEALRRRLSPLSVRRPRSNSSMCNGECLTVLKTNNILISPRKGTFDRGSRCHSISGHAEMADVRCRSLAATAVGTLRLSIVVEQDVMCHHDASSPTNMILRPYPPVSDCVPGTKHSRLETAAAATAATEIGLHATWRLGASAHDGSDPNSCG